MRGDCKREVAKVQSAAFAWVCGPGAKDVLDVATRGRRSGGNRAKTHRTFKIPRLHLRKAGAPGVLFQR